MRLSEKLGALSAAVAVLPLIVASILLLYWVSSYATENATGRLQTEARAAASVYRKRLDQLQSASQRFADEIADRALVSAEKSEPDNTNAWARLQDMLPGAQNEYGLDFIIVADSQGRVIARHNDRPSTGETLIGSEDPNPLAQKVLAEGTQLRNSPGAGAIVEGGERLERLGLKNIAQVSNHKEPETKDALVLEACSPIFSAKRFIGLVLIGQVLNNYYRARPGSNSLQSPMLAEVHSTLFPSTDRDAGALVALGNTIIASSIQSGGGQEPPLKGQACHPDNAEETLSAGDRNYSTSWQPINSPDGIQIGAIGVAVSTTELRGPIAALRTALFVIGAIGCLAAGGAGLLFGRSLASRINALSDAANRMSLGELSTPVKDPADPETKNTLTTMIRDEISQLAEQMDQARESFRQAIERLRRR